MRSKRLPKALSSLTARLLLILVLYASVLVASFAMVNAAVTASLDNAFPSMDTVQGQQEALDHDRFNELSQHGLSRCVIVVFDSRQQRLYASDKAAAEDLTPSFAWNMGSLDRIEEEDFAGLANCVVERYDYETAEGQERVLLLATPVLNEEAYERIVGDSGRLWLFLIPIFSLATIVAVMLMIGTARRAVSPLDEAISSYKDDEGHQRRGRAPVCMELEPIHDNFFELMERLQQEQEGKQRLMADVSHDLKTPLTVINGYAHALRDDRVPESSRLKYLSVIAERSASASRLLDDLFDYAKMEHPDFRVAADEVDAYEEVRRIVIARSTEADETGCLLEADVPEGSARIRADERLLARALNNLLDNAIKHGGNGARIRVECASIGDMVSIRVANTGRSIPDGIKKVLFEPFVTGDDARISGNGTGLGLAIAQRCVELNGGRVFLEDAPPDPFVVSFVCELPSSGIRS